MTYAGTKVLVTGADGFIGSHLTEELVACGARVTALSLYNSFDSHGWLDHMSETTRGKLKLVRGDIRDAAFVRRITRDQEIVFHLAALIAIPQSYVAAQSYVESNVMGTLNVLEACREHGVGRVVQTSTSEVYGTAQTVPISESHPLHGQSPYAASKIGADMLAEAFARSFDMPIALLRPFNTYGPRQSERAILPALIRQALDPSCPAILVGDTSPRRDLTFVSDMVAAFVALGGAESLSYGSPYNAGTGQAVTIGELVRLVMEKTDCGKPVVTDPIRMRPVNSEVRVLLADSSRLHAEAGWKPQVGLSEGIERTTEWWRARLRSGLVRREIGYIT